MRTFSIKSSTKKKRKIFQLQKVCTIKYFLIRKSFYDHNVLTYNIFDLQYHQCSVAISEAGNNSLRKKLLAFWTPYILSYTPGALPICEKKFRRFFPKNLRVKNEKSIKNVVTNFLEFIGFMVFKTTILISRVSYGLENNASKPEIFPIL